MTKQKINIKRAYSPPNPSYWTFCGDDYDYKLFEKDPPMQVAVKIVKQVFGENNLDDKEFCYIPRKYNGSNCCKDQIEVYYRKIK